MKFLKRPRRKRSVSGGGKQELTILATVPIKEDLAYVAPSATGGDDGDRFDFNEDRRENKENDGCGAVDSNEPRKGVRIFSPRSPKSARSPKSHKPPKKNVELRLKRRDTKGSGGGGTNNDINDRDNIVLSKKVEEKNTVKEAKVEEDIKATMDVVEAKENEATGDEAASIEKETAKEEKEAKHKDEATKATKKEELVAPSAALMSATDTEASDKDTTLANFPTATEDVVLNMNAKKGGMAKGSRETAPVALDNDTEKKMAGRKEKNSKDRRSPAGHERKKTGGADRKNTRSPRKMNRKSPATTPKKKKDEPKMSIDSNMSSSLPGPSSARARSPSPALLPTADIGAIKSPPVPSPINDSSNLTSPVVSATSGHDSMALFSPMSANSEKNPTSPTSTKSVKTIKMGNSKKAKDSGGFREFLWEQQSQIKEEEQASKKEGEEEEIKEKVFDLPTIASGDRQFSGLTREISTATGMISAQRSHATEEQSTNLPEGGNEGGVSNMVEDLFKHHREFIPDDMVIEDQDVQPLPTRPVNDNVDVVVDDDYTTFSTAWTDLCFGCIPNLNPIAIDDNAGNVDAPPANKAKKRYGGKVIGWNDDVQSNDNITHDNSTLDNITYTTNDEETLDENVTRHTVDDDHTYQTYDTEDDQTYQTYQTYETNPESRDGTTYRGSMASYSYATKDSMTACSKGSVTVGSYVSHGTTGTSESRTTAATSVSASTYETSVSGAATYETSLDGSAGATTNGGGEGKSSSTSASSSTSTEDDDNTAANQTASTSDFAPGKGKWLSRFRTISPFGNTTRQEDVKKEEAAVVARESPPNTDPAVSNVSHVEKEGISPAEPSPSANDKTGKPDEGEFKINSLPNARKDDKSTASGEQDGLALGGGERGEPTQCEGEVCSDPVQAAASGDKKQEEKDALPKSKDILPALPVHAPPEVDKAARSTPSPIMMFDKLRNSSAKIDIKKPATNALSFARDRSMRTPSPNITGQDESATAVKRVSKAKIEVDIKSRARSRTPVLEMDIKSAAWSRTPNIVQNQDTPTPPPISPPSIPSDTSKRVRSFSPVNLGSMKKRPGIFDKFHSRAASPNVTNEAAVSTSEPCQHTPAKEQRVGSLEKTVEGNENTVTSAATKVDEQVGTISVKKVVGVFDEFQSRPSSPDVSEETCVSSLEPRQKASMHRRANSTISLSQSKPSDELKAIKNQEKTTKMNKKTVVNSTDDKHAERTVRSLPSALLSRTSRQSRRGASPSVTPGTRIFDKMLAMNEKRLGITDAKNTAMVNDGPNNGARIEPHQVEEHDTNDAVPAIASPINTTSNAKKVEETVSTMVPNKPHKCTVDDDGTVEVSFSVEEEKEDREDREESTKILDNVMATASNEDRDQKLGFGEEMLSVGTDGTDALMNQAENLLVLGIGAH